MVHQELTLFDNLSVAENIYAGNPTSHNRLGKMNRKEISRGSKEKLELLGLNLDCEMPVSLLTIAERQIVEIAKALTWEPKLLVLDEATSALDTNQVARLFKVIRMLRDQGVGSVFVSHRMYEVLQIAEEAIVIKDGEIVGHFQSIDRLTEMDLSVGSSMVGSSVDMTFPPRGTRLSSQPSVLAKGLTNDVLKDVTIEYSLGKLSGLGGLRGHGQESFLQALFGITAIRSGDSASAKSHMLLGA